MSGFQLAKKQSDGDTCGKLMSYQVDAAHATLLAPGDVIRITGTAGTTGIGEVDAAAAAQSISGVIAAIDFNLSGEALSETGLPATTAGSLKAHVDPRLLFEVDVSNGPLVVANVGLNADIVATAATKTGGLSRSNMTLNATGVAVTQTLQFRIVQLLEDEAGVLGGRALVRPNNTTMSDGAAGV